MRKEKREQKLKEIQEFRYGVIAELTNPYLSRGSINQLIRDKASREYVIPYSGKNKIKPSCIKNWLKNYRKYGMEGLLPKTRSDYGTCRSMKEQDLSVFLTYLENHPKLTAASALKKLQAEGKITSRISSSSLSRLVIASGMDRENRIRMVSEEKNLKFNFFYPLECVQADAMHSFAVADSKGKKRMAILMSFIDDATRRILYANISFRERSLEFEAGIKHILKAHGKIGMLYTDHGSSFVSIQTKRMLDILGIHLAHSRVGRPQGRGKKERFFRTAQDQFFRPLDNDSIKSLADLNARFHTWLESEYHRSPHRGLMGKTPLEVWMQKAGYIVHMDPTVDLDEIFLHEESRKVYKDSTLTLKGTLYEVSPALIGKRVKLLFDPRMPQRPLKVMYDGKCYGQAKIVDTYANSKIKRNFTSNGSFDINDDQPPFGAAYSSRPQHPSDPISPIQAVLSASQIELYDSQKEEGKDEDE